MKNYSKTILFMLMSFCFANAHSQTIIDINDYFDNGWKECDSSHATFVRYCVYDSTNNEFNGAVTDIYLKSKTQQPEMQGTYLHNELSGDCVFFYENGNRKMQGKYAHDMKTGLWKYWYENGKRKALFFYMEGNIQYFINYWDEDANQIITNGNGEGVIKAVEEKEKSTTTYVITVKDSLPVGTWKEVVDKDYSETITYDSLHHPTVSYYNNYKKFLFSDTTFNFDIEYYTRNKFKDEQIEKLTNNSVYFIRSFFNNIKYKAVSDSATIKNSNHPPVFFQGGEKGLMIFIRNNLKYPQEAKDSEIQGRVIATFFVEKDGTVNNIYILKDIGGGCGDEVKRVLLGMAKWIPAIKNGKPISYRYTIPLVFELQ